jgi:hypothetical protein
MSSRLDTSWLVLVSHQTDEGNRCVDLFSRPDGTFGFEEFRRDPEDMGAWTPVSYFSGRAYPTESAARAAARGAVSWLGPLLDHEATRRPVPDRRAGARPAADLTRSTPDPDPRRGAHGC